MNQTHADADENTPGIIKIIGIGQNLRGDDAAGLAAVRLWQKSYPIQASRPEIQVELAELPGIELLSLIEGASCAILVDAVRSGAKAGTVYHLSEDQLEAFQAGSGSAHGFGIAETLAIGRKLLPDRMPVNLILVGIEAGQLNLGAALSPEVISALPDAAHLIEQSLAQFEATDQGPSTSRRISPR